MEPIRLPPLKPEDFIKKIKTSQAADMNSYMAYFSQNIKSLSLFTIGPYFWFVPDNHLGRIVEISNNCHEYTPYTKEEWLNTTDPPGQLASIINPEHRDFMFAASSYAMQLAEHLNTKGLKPNVSTYLQVYNAQKELRWMLIQLVDFYLDEAGICQSVLVAYTDISHLPSPKEAMMTVKVENSAGTQLFKVLPLQGEVRQLLSCKVSVREHQVLSLMARGYSSIQIAQELGIAYDTVENHKRRLRAKTGTHNAAELMSYVMANHLI